MKSTNSYSKLDLQWLSAKETNTQRMLATDWRQVLLKYQDEIVIKGKVRKLKAKSIGVGVVEVYIEKI